MIHQRKFPFAFSCLFFVIFQFYSCEGASICIDLPSINHGRLLLEDFTDSTFTLGESIQYECDIGFEPVRSNSMITCVEENGVANWTVTQNLCKVSLISCNDPGYIENSNRLGHLFTFPNNITYICNEGYRMLGTNEKTMTKLCGPKGQWIPNKPVTCEAIVCPILSDLLNGKVISTQRKLNSVATYECDRHYVLSGSNKRICQEDGTWTGDAPICKEITCYGPGAIQHVRVLPQKSIYKAGDLVIFTCKYGSHQITSKCLETGEWSTRPPVCPGPPKTDTSLLITTLKPDIDEVLEKKGHPCDDPGTIKNGQRKFVGNGINGTVTYLCDDGYRLIGKGTLQCMPNGKWDLDKLPICVAPLSVPHIIGIVFGVLLIGALGILGYLWYRWREKKIRGYGEKCKALTADATDLEEITGLEKNKKPIPVTVL
ncbi:membrane cofactor protein isoform X2 [Parasteatoda tepidariorum]|uniref:membrane cofactor protein isoform X2 n=1 Tax=Parasteatoda tepidariorum TaxID=114398 RepID=UPI00077F8E2C|nr:CUB and sushi domain-containing protein 1 isoform X2 [Parasteatoda tepidariorum]